jgi:hypothetical protein
MHASVDKDFVFHWFDEEDDDITLSSESELQNALNCMKSFKNVFMFIITAQASVKASDENHSGSTKDKANTAVHTGVMGTSLSSLFSAGPELSGISI